MPISADDFLQQNTGITTSTTSHEVSLPSGTTAGSCVVVIFGAGAGLTAPTGFVTASAVGGSAGVYYKPDVAAGEGLVGSTSWTFTSTSASTTWAVYEIANVASAEPLEVVVNSGTVSRANGSTLSTGTTGSTAGLNVMALAIYTALTTTDTTSYSGYTNGFEEILDLDPPSGQYNLAVARKFVDGTTSTFESTATFATSGAAAQSVAFMVVFRAAGSPITTPLVGLWGFEQGTHGGLGNAGATSLSGAITLGPTGTWGTNYLIQAGSARNSSYGLRIVQSAVAAQVRLGSLGAKTGSFGFNVRVVSSTGTVIVAAVADIAGGAAAQLVYDTSTSKFGVRAGSTGTISYQSGTTAQNTWVWIDLGVKTNSSTYVVDWQLETGTDTYTAQPQATLTGQPTAGITFESINLGGTNTGSQTMTADYDDVIASNYYAAFPLGPHQARLLTVDTSGTPSVSGTTTNFSVFTSNGTLAAWNATNARNAVDEVPPTISASADGVVQTAVAASDYMEFPMATYTCSATEAIAGVRVLIPEWGGTGTGTGTIGYRGHDGTTETIFQAASASYDADSLTAASATYPRWMCAMWPSTNGWTQTELNAAVLRVGFSTDATPDMGVHALYLEVAIRKINTEALFGSLDSGEPWVEAHRDHTNLGLVGFTAHPTATKGLIVNYQVDGVDQSQVTLAANASPQTVNVQADSLSRVNQIKFSSG